MDQNDGQLLFELDQNPNVMRYINGGVPTTMDELENRLIPRLLKYRNPEKGWGLWQVSITDTNTFIGFLLVRPMNFFEGQPEYHNLELGWRFKEAFWGQGFANEAAMALKQVFESVDEVTHLSANAMEENTASIAIMKKLGMSFIKKEIVNEPQVNTSIVYYQVTL